MIITQSKTNTSDWYNQLLQERVIWQYPGHGPHTILSLNSNHSDFYMNSDYLARNPSLTNKICLALYQTINNKQQLKPDWVITYPPFGIYIGFCLAELFNCKFGYINSLAEPNICFDLQANETVLLCADDINTGTCMHKVINAAKDKGVKIIDLLAVVGNYSGKQAFDNMEIVSLITKKINVWKPEDCPLCKTGSQALSVRENWPELTSTIPTIVSK